MGGQKYPPLHRFYKNSSKVGLLLQSSPQNAHSLIWLLLILSSQSQNQVCPETHHQGTWHYFPCCDALGVTSKLTGLDSFSPPYGKSFSADLKPGQLQVRPGASVTSHPQESWGERGTSIKQAHQPVFLFSSESAWPSLLVGVDLILWQAGFGMVTPSAPHSMATSESSFALKPNSTALHSSQPHLPHLWTVLVFLEPHLTQMTCMLLVLLDFLNLFSVQRRGKIYLRSWQKGIWHLLQCQWISPLLQKAGHSCFTRNQQQHHPRNLTIQVNAQVWKSSFFFFKQST